MELRDLFRNQDATEFCIVTIPTQLAIAESKRLLAALGEQGVAVRNVVVNQVILVSKKMFCLLVPTIFSTVQRLKRDSFDICTVHSVQCPVQGEQNFIMHSFLVFSTAAGGAVVIACIVCSSQ